MKKLHVFFIALVAHGHTIPIVDMAKLFTSHGVKTTIISTPAFAEPILRARGNSGTDINLSIVKFPPEESGLPEHIVSLDQVTNDLLPMFNKAVALLQEPVEKLIEEFNPTCIVSDMFLPWTVDSAAKFGIPRLVFHGTCYFALCATAEMSRHKPFKNLSSDSEPFVLSNLPHRPKFVRTQVAQFLLEEHDDPFGKFLEQVAEADLRSYGVVVNSFHELEPEYADYYQKVLGLKAWSLGPLLLSNSAEEKVQRGKKSVIDVRECLAWLDSKKPKSVVYVCFGSWASFSSAQIHEIAFGLESSGQDFIWVVRKSINEHENKQGMPEGFEERVKDKGLIIRGWAPQLLILDHPSIGAFVTHCGWNSIIEGVCAGVPMITWPLFGEQFFNEKLVTEVLKTGISVGNKKWQQTANEGVEAEAVSVAVRRVMGGEEALEMRSRAKYYKEMGSKAVEVGGSSYTSMNDLIQELSSYKKEQDVN